MKPKIQQCISPQEHPKCKNLIKIKKKSNKKRKGKYSLNIPELNQGEQIWTEHKIPNTEPNKFLYKILSVRFGHNGEKSKPGEGFGLLPKRTLVRVMTAGWLWVHLLVPATQSCDGWTTRVSVSWDGLQLCCTELSRGERWNNHKPLQD